jgi:putative exporter of polyketide antibiotics
MKKLFSTQGLGWAIVIFILGLFIKNIYDQIKIGFTSVGASMLDLYARKCATASLENLIIIIVFTLILAAIISQIVVLTIDLIRRIHEKVIKKPTKSQSKNDSLQSDNDKNAETVKNKLEKLAEETVTIDKKLNKIKILDLSARIFIILAGVYSLFYTIFPIIQHEAFDKDITQVTPYISTAEVNQLKSDWVSMESYKDYKLIDDRISEIREENNLSSIYRG